MNITLQNRTLKEAIEQIETTNYSSLAVLLSWMWNKIQCVEAKEIAKAINKTDLNSLNIYLCFNKIGDEGLKALAQSLEDTKLSTLGLSLKYNKFGIIGTKADSQSNF